MINLSRSPFRFNSTHDSLKKKHAQDVALTKAKVRKLELQVESLKSSLEEKVGYLRAIWPFITHHLRPPGEREGRPHSTMR